MALTEKQKRFVDEYLVDLNATQAALRAGYSEKTANEQGARLLANVSVRELLQDSIKKRSERTEITQDSVISEIKAIAFHKAADFSDSDLKYSNKLKALELLGKHLGMFTDKVEHSGGVDIGLDDADRALLEKVARRLDG